MDAYGTSISMTSRNHPSLRQLRFLFKNFVTRSIIDANGFRSTVQSAVLKVQCTCERHSRSDNGGGDGKSYLLGRGNGYLAQVDFLRCAM